GNWSRSVKAQNNEGGAMSTEPSDNFYLDAQRRELRRLRRILPKCKEVRGAILIGSLQNEYSDSLSDVDLLLYVEGAPWTREFLDEKLTEWGITPELHYWTGLEKHRLIANGIRFDVSIRSHYAVKEMLFWPELFFDESAIIVDVDGDIEKIVFEQRRKERLPADPLSDYSAYVTSLFNVAVQFIRGELINSRSRATGLVEAEARLLGSYRVGSLKWREPSRDLEREFAEAVPRISRIAFAASPDDFRRVLIDELDEVREAAAPASSVRQLAGYYVAKLDAYADEA
ncbi:hypothetical protein, partial [Flexivirga caeni]|uniref:hypothetical protein n=1 Tax=Flexivirga caeni TaxID=2294115 RepID=UPI001C65C4D7